MKDKILWLSKDYEYNLWAAEPEWQFETYTANKTGRHLAPFCLKEFEKFCPSLKLKTNQRVQVKLINTKMGISLRKVGKAKSE